MSAGGDLTSSSIAMTAARTSSSRSCFGVPFRYYFCQREAIETLVWLVEISSQRDAQKLIEAYATIFEKDLFTQNITFQTTMDGRRQLRRYVPERTPRAYKTSHPKTCAASLSRWPPARARPGSWRWPSSGPGSTNSGCRARSCPPTSWSSLRT